MREVNVRRAQELDGTDPIAHVRALFELPDGVIFMDVNSVGPMSNAVRAKAKGLLDD